MGQVSVRGIRKSCGAVDVTQGIDLEVHDGGFMVFVGPSGCGKSATLRMIAGLESITGRDLLIDGVRCNDLRPADRGSASAALAEHRGDASIIHLRVEGVSDLPSAKVGAEHSRVESGQTVGLLPDASWALAFDADRRLAA